MSFLPPVSKEAAGSVCLHVPPEVLLQPVAVCSRSVLENGVRVVTESIPGVRSVSVGVLVECGSRHETRHEAGLAHFCEHLLFQGTSGRHALEIARQVESIGHVGGFTARDYTCYYASTLHDYQFHALDLLGDVLLNSTFPEDLLERERRAILSEIERGWDVPAQHLHEVTKARALGAHMLGRPVAGTIDAVERHTREDVIYFLQRQYTPNRIVIAAAGRVDHADFVAQTRDAFWRLIGEGDPRPYHPPIFQPGVGVNRTNSSQTYFCLILPAPRYASSERYAVHVLDWILGGGLSSRLSRRLREERGLVYNVESDYQAYREAGMIVVEGSTAPEYLDEVAGNVLETVEGLFSGREPVTAEELWRARTHLQVQQAISSENVHTRMCRLATQELYFGTFLAADEIMARIEAVSLDALAAVSREVLFPGLRQARLEVAGPLSDPQTSSQRLSELACRWFGVPDLALVC